MLRRRRAYPSRGATRTPSVISPCQEEGQWVRERGGTGWFVLGLRWAFWADDWLLRRWLESG